MKEENSIEIFREVAREPYNYLRNLKEKNGKSMVGSVCTYTLEEILLAAGFAPFPYFRRVTGIFTG